VTHQLLPGELNIDVLNVNRGLTIILGCILMVCAQHVAIRDFGSRYDENTMQSQTMMLTFNADGQVFIGAP